MPQSGQHHTIILLQSARDKGTRTWLDSTTVNNAMAGKPSSSSHCSPLATVKRHSNLRCPAVLFSYFEKQYARLPGLQQHSLVMTE